MKNKDGWWKDKKIKRRIKGGGVGEYAVWKKQVRKFKYSFNMAGKYYGGHMFQISIRWLIKRISKCNLIWHCFKTFYTNKFTKEKYSLLKPRVSMFWFEITVIAKGGRRKIRGFVLLLSYFPGGAIHFFLIY